tara:strand:+ start:1149 stop:2444 length:1296 start_codon:yes stop_codon:yes gene_type:complete
MPDSLVIVGGLLQTSSGSRRLDILVKDGLIAEIGESGSLLGRGEVIDASDALVMPGFVDIQVHFRTPGGEESEDIVTGAAGAALGGVTACVMMPNTVPTIDNVELVNDVLRLGARTPCDVRTSAAITVDRLGERLVDFPKLYASGVRVFTDDGTVVDDPVLMEGALQATANMPGAVISQHAEESTMVEGGVINEGAVSQRLGLKGRPSEAEAVIVQRDIALAAKTGGRYHVLHMSTAEATHLVRSAKAAGTRVTSEVTPQHLVLTEEDVERLGSSGKMNPPLRTGDDVAALRAGLLDKTIDAIATDHAPHSAEAKAVGLVDAPPGMLGVETMASVVWSELVVPGFLSAEQFVFLLSHSPARIADIVEHGGELHIGDPAHLTVFDPKDEWIVSASTLQSKSVNTPWPNKQLTGRVRHTICRGALVVQNGVLV